MTKSYRLMILMPGIHHVLYTQVTVFKINLRRDANILKAQGCQLWLEVTVNDYATTINIDQVKWDD